ncbi:hypothetical protein PR202_gn00737 [Eleusine coracana subsp. coracana]|uniref:Uncharacterized protein n=1 Tax=Eleusine coracana subsp. coracana TaxID=191504 RepID=A0AAV5G4Y0_ELECO|nr:hypothetical protein PR202_gn00737 [Eleusine coracana subsp. coracana]
MLYGRHRRRISTPEPDVGGHGVPRRWIDGAKLELPVYSVGGRHKRSPASSPCEGEEVPTLVGSGAAPGSGAAATPRAGSGVNLGRCSGAVEASSSSTPARVESRRG